MSELAKIAHRGNFLGAMPEYENTIRYLNNALTLGFWIECDVQMHNGELHFGHDEPQELVDFKILTHERTICHAKDLESLQVLHNLGAHYFWHQEDRVTLTSQGLIWCYPGEHPRHPNAIWLDLQDVMIPRDTTGIFGICADDFS